MSMTSIVSKGLLRGTIILALLILSLQAIPAFGFVINQDPFSYLVDEYKGLYSTQEYKQITLERINYHRELAGLPKVILNETLSLAAQAHADYLSIHDYVGHDEDPQKDGFTGQYAQNRVEYFGYDWGSVGEVISFGYTASDGVDALMAAIYHRFIILNPDFLEVGIGDAIHPTYVRVQVIVFGRQKSVSPPSGLIGIYPGSKQKGVSSFFNSDIESPDPVPDKDLVGYPISIHFSKEFQISPLEFQVYLGDDPLEANSVNSSAQNPKAFSIIPVNKLEPNKEYTVVFLATVNGNPYSKTWSFNTIASDTLKADPTSLTITQGGSASVIVYNTTGALSYKWTNPNVIEIAKNSLIELVIKGKSLGFSTITVEDTLTSQTAEIHIHVVDKDSATTSFNIKPGWNLLSPPITLDLESLLQKDFGISSIWKWNSLSNRWAVRLPQFEDKGEAYAASKQFDFLTQIRRGEGFWVNALEQFPLSLEGLAQGGILEVRGGWNLLGLKKQGTKTIPEIFGTYEEKAVSIWKWENGTWSVYLPSQVDKGKAYADQKSFNHLDSISWGEGFWVNASEDFLLE